MKKIGFFIASLVLLILVVRFSYIKISEQNKPKPTIKMVDFQ